MSHDWHCDNHNVAGMYCVLYSNKLMVPITDMTHLVTMLSGLAQQQDSMSWGEIGERLQILPVSFLRETMTKAITIAMGF